MKYRRAITSPAPGPPASARWALLCLALAAALPAARANVWPENIGAWHRVSAATVTLRGDQALWNEYGFKDGETAAYQKGEEKFSAAAYRLLDSTGAMATYEWLRPGDAKPSKLASLSAETRDGVLLVHGNYVLSFAGYKPQTAEVAAMVEQLQNVESAPLPTLAGYLPDQGLVANSERYIVGPEGLARFGPAIPPSTAAFHMGAEAQVGTFQGPSGEMKLALFSYPTPQIAMGRVAEFQKIPGAMAKRSGPMVAVVVAPANPDAAEKLLSLVRYQASITLNERVPTRRDNIGDLIINAFLLIGILLIFCTVAGLAFAAMRIMARRGGKGGEAEVMILLHLEDRRSQP